MSKTLLSVLAGITFGAIAGLASGCPSIATLVGVTTTLVITIVLLIWVYKASERWAEDITIGIIVGVLNWLMFHDTPIDCLSMGIAGAVGLLLTSLHNQERRNQTPKEQ